MVRGVANSRTMKADNEARIHTLNQLSPSPCTLISLLAAHHLLAPTDYQHIPLDFPTVFSSTPLIALP